MKFKRTEAAMAILLVFSLGANVALYLGAQKMSQTTYELVTSAHIVATAQLIGRDKEVLVALAQGDSAAALNQLSANIKLRKESLHAYAVSPQATDYIQGLALRHLDELDDELRK